MTCVYDMVRSHPGMLSVDAYAVGNEEYVVEYKFQDKGKTFTGGIGISGDMLTDGRYAYTNETPPGQSDNSGLVELDFLGDGMFDDMYRTCHLMPTFDDTIRLPGTPPDPPRQKVDMSSRAN